MVTPCKEEVDVLYMIWGELKTLAPLGYNFEFKSYYVNDHVPTERWTLLIYDINRSLYQITTAEGKVEIIQEYPHTITRVDLCEPSCAKAILEIVTKYECARKQEALQIATKEFLNIKALYKELFAEEYKSNP